MRQLQKELGLERMIKLASNEGPFGPFPEAREAIERCAGELNRYPDGGAFRLRTTLAERLDLRFEEVAPGAGSDGLVDCLSQAALEPELALDLLDGLPRLIRNEIVDRGSEEAVRDLRERAGHRGRT